VVSASHKTTEKSEENGGYRVSSPKTLQNEIFYVE
jgi:hypothetical protein